MTKTVSTSKKPRKQHSPEFRSEALKLAERIGVTAAYFHERRSLNNFHRDRVITFEQIAE
ncbi:hypothetical protein U9697_20935 [Escherichia coli]